MSETHPETKYTLTLTEDQLKLVNTAIERYFRCCMGQFVMSDFVHDLVFSGFEYRPGVQSSEAEFARRCARREDAEAAFSEAYHVAHPGNYKMTPDVQRLIDMWAQIRHQLWVDAPEPKGDFTTDAFPPFLMSGDTPVSVERVEPAGEAQ